MHLIYQWSLIIGAVALILMAGYLAFSNREYRAYSIYLRARQFTVLWLVAFGVGYMIHAFTGLRFFWPTAAAALTVSYFHLGAICFCWGYIPLLKPDFFTRKIAVRDTIIYAIGLIGYWTVAMLWKETSLITLLPTLVFFTYCACNAVVFYRIYHQVSFRLLVMSHGNVSGFVHWMQASCDIIIFFGIFLVAVTVLFPNSISYLTPVEALLGIVLFGYIVHSLNRYGDVIATATEATEDVARQSYYSPKGNEKTKRAPGA